ncbi:MAG: hypothetical protein DMF97_12205 [Acidobacteria bacterium]|nr:MAG: hypothetical protein DMF97_12205 [Acidobacteriota bacterium]
MRIASIMFSTAVALVAASIAIVPGTLVADSVRCDLSDYKAAPGLTAGLEQDLLAVSWNGQAGSELRARYAIDGGQPIVRDFSIRKTGGQWSVLGRDLTPEYRVTTGVRRMTEQQAQPLRDAGVELTPAVIEKNRWYAFWDAPLVMPDGPEMAAVQAQRRGQTAPPAARVLGGPRSPADIRHANASFHATSCSVKTDGATIEVAFPGLSMGIFSGTLRFTAYRGANLLRMDAVASTNEPWVAYKYEAGLKGLSTDLTPRVTWHDTGGHVQHNAFGGVNNETIVPVKAAGRVVVAEGKAGSIAAFPPPHTFFFTREVDTNLGYVWYRKDAADRFGIGIRQADREENPQYVENFALFNAPPGTKQRMGVYFLANAAAAEPTRDAVLAYTHGDTFKVVPGYKTMVNHFHLRFTERVRASGSFDTPMQDLAAMKALGLNIVGLSDFHGDMHPNDPGPLRFKDTKDYAERNRARTSAATTTSCSPRTCTGPKCARPVSRSRRRIRSTARRTTPAAPTMCRRCSTPKTATGITRIRAPRAQPVIPI